MPLVKPLTKLGVSKAVILPKSWLEYHEERLGHVIDTVFMEVDGYLKITPAPEKKPASKKEVIPDE